MRISIFSVMAAAGLSACSSETAAPAEKAEKAAAVDAGEYEIATTVDALRSTDGTSPATKLKVGAAAPDPAPRVCVAANGTIDGAAFAEAGESCKVDNSYVRGGKLSLQLSCTREGLPGQIFHTVDGKFTSDSFDAQVTTGTFLPGPGDYEMTRTVKGKRVGDCSAAAAEENAQ